MFVNFVALMLVNLVTALVLVAYYVFVGLGSPDQRPWAPGFAVTGFIALTTGFVMIFTWPLPGSHNIAFGETSVLLGGLLLGAALALAMGWSLLSLAVIAVFSGLYGVVAGIRIISLEMTRSPILSGIGFILAGLGGILILPVVYWLPYRWARAVTAVVLLLAAAIWAYTGYQAVWGHLADFSNWVPLILRK